MPTRSKKADTISSGLLTQKAAATSWNSTILGIYSLKVAWALLAADQHGQCTEPRSACDIRVGNFGGDQKLGHFRTSSREGHAICQNGVCEGQFTGSSLPAVLSVWRIENSFFRDFVFGFLYMDRSHLDYDMLTDPVTNSYLKRRQEVTCLVSHKLNTQPC